MNSSTAVWMERLAAVGVAALLILSLLYSISHFRMTTDLGIFLPPPQTNVEKLLLQQLNRGATSHLIFIAIDGADPDDLVQANRDYSEQLGKLSRIHRVLNGKDLVTEEELQAIFAKRYLLMKGDPTETFSEAGLTQALQDRLQGLMSSSAILEKQYLQNDPTAELLSLIEFWTGKSEDAERPAYRDGVWVTEDETRTLLVIETSISGFDLGNQSALVGELQSTFADTVSRRFPQMSMVMAGPSVFAVETKQQIQRDVRILTIAASLLVGLFLFSVYRSFTLLGLILVPLGLGIIASIGSVIWVFGAIHGITLAFGVTLTGVAVDYPIHLFSHLDESPKEVKQHAAKIWPTLRLGVVTTVIAYLSLVFSGFEGLKQLGLFTVVGLLTAAAVTRWILPTILPSKLPRIPAAYPLHRYFEHWGRKAYKLQVGAMVLVILSLGYLVLTEENLRDIDVDSLSPIPPERRMQDRQIRRDLGIWHGGNLLVVINQSAERVLQDLETLHPALDAWQDEGIISKYTSAAQFLPSQKTQRQRQANLPAPQELRRRLADAMEGMPFKSDTFEPFVEDIERSRSDDLLKLENLQDSPMGARISPILFSLEDSWVSMVLLNQVVDPETIRKDIKKFRSVDVHYMNLKQQSSLMMDAAIKKVLRVIGWGALFIYIVLALSFKCTRKPLRVLGPTVAAVVLVSALLIANGIQLTLFHLVSLLLVIGLGLDYSLFFNRLRTDDDEWSTTFRALWICCLTTVLVFGALLVSETPPLRSIGQTVSVGSALCLVLGAVWASSEGMNRYTQRIKKALRKKKKRAFSG